jgi:hypothetical protein
MKLLISFIVFLVSIIIGLLIVLYYTKDRIIVVKEPSIIKPINCPENKEMPIYPHMEPSYQNNHSKNDYQQIGTLVSIGEESIILPLFGKKINNDRWLYYTASETNNQLKIDIKSNNKFCKDKYTGCNELYDNDEIEVPAYNKMFQVTLYVLI